jgi:hypothetical protein
MNPEKGEKGNTPLTKEEVRALKEKLYPAGREPLWKRIEKLRDLPERTSNGITYRKRDHPKYFAT